MCYTLSNPRLIKSSSNSIWYNFQKFSSCLRRPETILEIREQVIFLEVIKQSIFYKFLKDLTNHRKKTNKLLVFSQRPVITILKHYDHTLMHLEIFWDTVFRRGFQGRRPKGHNYVLWKIIFSHEHVWIACVGAIYYGKCNYYVLINCVNVKFNQIIKVVSATKQLLKMCHLRHRLRTISFHRKVMFCSQDIQFFVFLINPWFNISVTSWGVLMY